MLRLGLSPTTLALGIGLPPVAALPSIYNTRSDSTLPGSQVIGFVAAAEALAVRINALPTPSLITFASLVTKSGDTYTFTARRTGNTANAETRIVTVAGSTNYPPGALTSDFGGTFPSVAVSFAAGSPTATFQIISPNAQPE